ncbi:hypothetical protein ACU4GH_19025 [Bradyrhizobium betae]
MSARIEPSARTLGNQLSAISTVWEFDVLHRADRHHSDTGERENQN